MKIDDDKYERLMLTIFFETLTIISFIVFYGKHPAESIQQLVFIELVLFFQLPFLSFIRNDFIPRRPTLIEKVLKLISWLILLIVIFGFVGLAIYIEPKSGISGLLLFIGIQCYVHRNKIANFFQKKKVKQGKKLNCI